MRQIPTAELCFDDVGGALRNFLKSLRMAGEDAAVNLEDDIVLTSSFEEKIRAVVEQKPHAVIQFFSRKSGLESRWETGRTYLWAQCTYYPPGLCSEIADWSAGYADLDHASQPLDCMVAEYLSAHRRKYWVHVPSLVDHRDGVSAIDRRRPRVRRSANFEA